MTHWPPGAPRARCTARCCQPAPPPAAATCGTTTGNSIINHMHIWGKVPNRSLLKAVSSFLVFSSVQLDIRLGTIQQLHHAVVAPTGEGKNDGSIMHRGGWWSKRWCMMDLHLMLLFLELLPQATAWNSQKISTSCFLCVQQTYFLLY